MPSEESGICTGTQVHDHEKSTADEHGISSGVCQLSQARKHMNQIFAAIHISYVSV